MWWSIGIGTVSIRSDCSAAAIDPPPPYMFQSAAEKDMFSVFSWTLSSRLTCNYPVIAHSTDVELWQRSSHERHPIREWWNITIITIAFVWRHVSKPKACSKARVAEIHTKSLKASSWNKGYRTQVHYTRKFERTSVFWSTFKLESVPQFLMYGGVLFQSLGAHVEKARSPYVWLRVPGTVNCRLYAQDCRVRTGLCSSSCSSK